jgi:hypothetical protein
MAKPAGDKPDLSTHPLVAKALGDSDSPTGLATLTGYAQVKGDSIRLYLSLDFQSYYDIPTSGIVATYPADPDNEMGPTVVCVKAGTQVECVRRSTQPAESYVQGGITAGYLQGAAPGGQAGDAGAAYATKCGICPSYIGAPGAAPAAGAAPGFYPLGTCTQCHCISTV